MQINHTDSTITTTINWTEEEKDIFIAAIEEIITTEEFATGLSGSMQNILIDFFSKNIKKDLTDC